MKFKRLRLTSGVVDVIAYNPQNEIMINNIIHDEICKKLNDFDEVNFVKSMYPFTGCTMNDLEAEFKNEHCKSGIWYKIIDYGINDWNVFSYNSFSDMLVDTRNFCDIE